MEQPQRRTSSRLSAAKNKKQKINHHGSFHNDDTHGNHDDDNDYYYHWEEQEPYDNNNNNSRTCHRPKARQSATQNDCGPLPSEWYMISASATEQVPWGFVCGYPTRNGAYNKEIYVVSLFCVWRRPEHGNCLSHRAELSRNNVVLLSLKSVCCCCCCCVRYAF